MDEASSYGRRQPTYYVIQARHRIDERSSGGPYGFFLCEPESKTLEEALADPAFRPYVLLLKSRILEELRRFLEAGAISREEVEDVLKSAESPAESQKR